jgi:hypothetical protein
MPPILLPPKSKNLIGCQEAGYLLPYCVGIVMDKETQPYLARLYASIKYRKKIWGRTRRITVEDIEQFAELWKNTLLRLNLSHTREAIDEADYKIDELFQQFFLMPLKQVREFHTALLQILKDDEKVPFYLWKTVESWGLQPMSEAQEVEGWLLQTQMAKSLAEVLEPKLSPQLKEALINSLKWRGAETLETIKQAISKGHEPKLKGKESCLFLEIDGKEIML